MPYNIAANQQLATPVTSFFQGKAMRLAEENERRKMAMEEERFAREKEAFELDKQSAAAAEARRVADDATKQSDRMKQQANDFTIDPEIEGQLREIASGRGDSASYFGYVEKAYPELYQSAVAKYDADGNGVLTPDEMTPEKARQGLADLLAKRPKAKGSSKVLSKDAILVAEESGAVIASNIQPGDETTTARAAKLAGLEKVVRDEARGRLTDEEISIVAAKLAESGSVTAMDMGGNAVLDKVVMEVEKMAGGDTSKALTNIVNPREERIRVNQGVKQLNDERMANNLPNLDLRLTQMEQIFKGKGDVPGFTMTAQTLAALSNNTLNQLFLSDKSNENQQLLQALANDIIKSRAGLAQTLPEERRIINEIGSGVFRSVEDVRVGLEAIRAAWERINDSIFLGYDKSVVSEWRARQHTIDDLVNIDRNEEGF
ncbi:MAG TPA: hypothetical protein VMX74_05220 [Pirellulales bacterium]|nr:hypothetical protein [Pirellulales bacterium]